MDVIYSMGSSSASCTYGNIIKAVEQELYRYFPQNYFKYTHVSSELIYRQLKKDADKSKAELNKREMPLIVIKPNFEAANDDIPFSKTLLTSNIYGSPAAISKKSIFPLIIDRDKGFMLGYRMNRDLISYDITIRVQTLVSQIDLYKMMENNMPWQGPYTQVFALESVIPSPLIRFVAQTQKLDIDKPEDIPVLMTYLRSHSRFPITYKIRNSTYNTDFFMYYQTPVNITISDLQVDSGSKKGMVDDIYEITFTVKTEFNLPGAYLLYGRKDLPKEINIGIKSDISDQSSTYIPIYTMYKLFDKESMMIAGLYLYRTSIIQTDLDKDGKDDTADIRYIIEKKYFNYINKYRNDPKYLDSIFKFVLVSDTDTLEDGKDYEIRWDNLTILLHNTNPYKTYRVILYANMNILNQELVESQDALNHQINRS